MQYDNRGKHIVDDGDDNGMSLNLIEMMPWYRDGFDEFVSWLHTSTLNIMVLPELTDKSPN